MATLFSRSERRGCGGLRARAGLGDRRAGTVVASRFLPGGRQLRIYADDSGTGGNLAHVARAGGKKVSVAGGSERGVRAGGRGATLFAVRRGNLGRAGSSGMV